MRPKHSNAFESYIVTDCDGNGISNVGTTHPRCDSSDEAFRTALHVVRKVWKDFEIGQICGVQHDGATVPLFRFQREGLRHPTQAVRFESEDLPWLTWTTHEATP